VSVGKPHPHLLYIQSREAQKEYEMQGLENYQKIDQYGLMKAVWKEERKRYKAGDNDHSRQ